MQQTVTPVVSMTPLISIIVPVYKVERYLPRCVDSILKQTYQKLEIILVDDGSPDRCGQICDEYAKRDARIHVIHKENGGLSSARNAGIDICQGEYLSFIDSDDIVSPYFIEILYHGIEKFHSDIASIEKPLEFVDGTEDSIQLTNHSEDFSTREITPKEAIRLMLYQAIPTGIQWRLYKRTIFDHIRFPLGYIHEDTATSHKLYMNAKSAALVDAKIYAYRHRTDSIVHAKFTAEKAISTMVGEQLVHDIVEYDPSLKAAAYSRAFALNYYVFIQAPLKDKESIKKLWDSILLYRDVVVKDTSPELRVKNRVGAKCTYFGILFSHMVGKLYKKISTINKYGKMRLHIRLSEM